MAPKTQQPYPVADSPFWLHVETRVQKWGALLLGGIVIAALCGFFSQGWLSDRTVTSADNTLSVHYDRYGRLMSDNDMRLTANAGSSQVVFTLGGDFMQDVEIRTLHPQPQKMYSQDGQLFLEYTRPDAQRPLTVWLGLTPQAMGTSTQRFSLNGAPAITVEQFIWP
ncbi:hypothetical protein ACUY4R_001115 [Kosakonia sp. BK9b]|uniref:hypothetical protein n=1 Tax=Kosakonia sp. TaxID=1916651 RepID=UPI0028A1B7C4|nr:hypothetical protein [Kosakonia sp.]